MQSAIIRLAITRTACTICENCHMIILCWPYLRATIYNCTRVDPPGASPPVSWLVPCVGFLASRQLSPSPDLTWTNEAFLASQNKMLPFRWLEGSFKLKAFPAPSLPTYGSASGFSQCFSGNGVCCNNYNCLTKLNEMSIFQDFNRSIDWVTFQQPRQVWRRLWLPQRLLIFDWWQLAKERLRVDGKPSCQSSSKMLTSSTMRNGFGVFRIVRKHMNSGPLHLLLRGPLQCQFWDGGVCCTNCLTALNEMSIFQDFNRSNDWVTFQQPRQIWKGLWFPRRSLIFNWWQLAKKRLRVNGTPSRQSLSKMVATDWYRFDFDGLRHKHGGHLKRLESIVLSCLQWEQHKLTQSQLLVMQSAIIRLAITRTVCTMCENCHIDHLLPGIHVTA